MSEWEELLDNPEYEPVRKGLQAGVALLEKYYRRADDTDVYFIAHVLDPTLKLEYLNAAWDEEYLNVGLAAFKSRFTIYRAKYEVSRKKPSTTTSPSTSIPASMKSGALSSDASTDNMDPFEEFHRYLRQPRLKRENFPNPIPWWGHQFEYPVLRLMARDYLAIPATTCIAERSFSLSARTDDPRRRQMKKLKFGGLQKLRAGYTDGRLSAEGEVMKKYIGDFDFDNEDYLD
ncbi:hypothetical protein M378DRAFT_73836 [Amanita muscaria Koide BX008]|uniref:HAT C-terminal dimerisation domain-containing protein n=1 Tax=Amanita muscaria (strain Koide BX008) TaxID=946122 RepID=A0A0C2SUU5_AMAMK|nr:hypothetical protein M378DRAFT_73836 [Amanita muscaria Koide BX008]